MKLPRSPASSSTMSRFCTCGAALLVLACTTDATAGGTQRQRAGLHARADMAALAALRQAVEAARRSDPALPFETVVKRLAFKPASASFANEPDPDNAFEPARFPRKRPHGVSAAEWRALLASHIDGGGENGMANYTLLDLNGDGRRDLVIDSYTGGTGLFQTISVLRQQGNRFVIPGAGPAAGLALSSDGMDASSLYTVNGRGGNQSGAFIRLRGQVYAAYRDSQYGVDNIYLLRPWRRSGQVPRLTIRYRYQLSVPIIQDRYERAPMRLTPELHQALETAARQAALRADAAPPATAMPICPIAADADEETRATSTGYGPGHYSFETVADVAVHVGSQCYIGQLKDWFGGYDGKHGLMAQLCIRKPENVDLAEEECYTVQGPRSVVAIEAGVGAL